MTLSMAMIYADTIKKEGANKIAGENTAIIYPLHNISRIIITPYIEGKDPEMIKDMAGNIHLLIDDMIDDISSRSID